MIVKFKEFMIGDIDGLDNGEREILINLLRNANLDQLISMGDSTLTTFLARALDPQSSRYRDVAHIIAGHIVFYARHFERAIQITQRPELKPIKLAEIALIEGLPEKYHRQICEVLLDFDKKDFRIFSFDEIQEYLEQYIPTEFAIIVAQYLKKMFPGTPKKGSKELKVK